MPVRVKCPNPQCDKVRLVHESHLDRKGRCPRCGTRFVLTDSSATMRRLGVPGSGLPNAIGRFIIQSQLGGGAFGPVYRAIDSRTNRMAALKVARPEHMVSQRRIEAILRDANSAARLRHPNIVPIQEVAQAGEYLYIASELVSAQPISERVIDGGLKPKDAARMVRHVAEAVAYAHDLGVLHRDINPDNVLVDDDDNVLLLDFGLAGLAQVGEAATGELALHGMPAYLAPEQADRKKKREANPASDQYAIGVLLYELLTGKPPFEGSPQEVLYEALHGEPVPPSRLHDDLPPELEAICLQAMAKKPEERYKDCRALADDLRRWAEGELVHARHAGAANEWSRWGAQPSGLTKFAALGLAVLAFLLGVSVCLVGFVANLMGLPQALLVAAGSAVGLVVMYGILRWSLGG